MKIIHNLIDIDLKLKSGKHLFVNGNNGLVDVVNKKDYLLIMSWKNQPYVEKPTEAEENAIFHLLMERGYLVDDSYDEEQERLRIIEEIKESVKKRMNQCRNVSFVLTYNCNFACPYCYEKDVKNKKILTKEQVDKIFEVNENCISRISFFGGEPLLLCNKEIIEYIINKAPNATYDMITNGYHLQEYFDIFEDLNISNIQVTLDGEKEIHNKTRVLKSGQGTFDRIMDGIRLYAENGKPITIRMNLTLDNMDSCMRLKQEIIRQSWAKNIKFERKTYSYEEAHTPNCSIPIVRCSSFCTDARISYQSP